MPRSLVTGAAGFIGSHVARHCLGLGHEVVAVDDLSGGFRDNVPEGATFFRGSVTDPELLDDLFRRHDFDFVYHLAAYAAEGLSHLIRRSNTRRTSRDADSPTPSSDPTRSTVRGRISVTGTGTWWASS